MNRCWPVYNYNCNVDVIEYYDVFGQMKTEIIKCYHDAATKKDFYERLKGAMRSRFWSRCEYETIFRIEREKDGEHYYLLPWVGSSDPEGEKIEVTDNEDYEWAQFAKWICGKKSRGFCADSSVLEIKIDIWDQIDFEWTAFSDEAYEAAKEWARDDDDDDTFWDCPDDDDDDDEDDEDDDDDEDEPIYPIRRATLGNSITINQISENRYELVKRKEKYWFTIAFLEWDEREGAFELRSIGMRYPTYADANLNKWVVAWTELETLARNCENE